MNKTFRTVIYRCVALYCSTQVHDSDRRPESVTARADVFLAWLKGEERNAKP